MHERRYHSPVDDGGVPRGERNMNIITIKDPVVLRLLTMIGEEEEFPQTPERFLREWNDHTQHQPILYSWDVGQIVQSIELMERFAQFRKVKKTVDRTALNEAQEIFRYALRTLRELLWHLQSTGFSDEPEAQRQARSTTNDLLRAVGEGEVGRESYKILTTIGENAGRDVSRFALPPIEYARLRHGEQVTVQHLKQFYSIGAVPPGRKWRVPGDVLVGVYIEIPSQHPEQSAPIRIYHRLTDTERRMLLRATNEKPVVIGRRGTDQQEEALSQQELRITIRPDEFESKGVEGDVALVSRRYLKLFFLDGRLHVEDVSKNHGASIVLPPKEQRD